MLSMSLYSMLPEGADFYGKQRSQSTQLSNTDMHTKRCSTSVHAGVYAVHASVQYAASKGGVLCQTKLDMLIHPDLHVAANNQLHADSQCLSVQVSMVSMSLYSMLPAVGKFCVEQGWTRTYIQIFMWRPSTSNMLTHNVCLCRCPCCLCLYTACCQQW